MESVINVKGDKMSYKKYSVLKCEKCGNLVEALSDGHAPLMCCGEKMVELEEKTADKTTEKHVPIIEKVEGGYKVVVGSTAHPMTEAHLIEWIELVTEDSVLRGYLTPDSAPEYTFITDKKALYAREYCNLHGLWKSEA